MELSTLVIDDSAEVRDFVVEYVLKPQGYLVEIATDGAEGLRKALEDTPDLILMDFEMPKMTGVEVLRELRKVNRDVPVILMTSHGSEEVAVEVFRLGVRDYIIKPFNPADMLAAIDRALAVTRLQREKEALTAQVMQTNQQLTQRVYELNALYEVGKSITALIQPNELLERVVDAVLSVTRSDECALVLVDSKTGKVQGHLKKSFGREHARPVTGMLPDISHLAPPGTDNNGAKNKIAATVLSVPLQVGQSVLGTLSISKRTTGNFTRHDDRVLRMLADYAAIAIQNLRLVHQLQQTKEREKQQIRGMFERYVAPSVVEQILEQPDQVGLGGKRQMVSVLFADIRGFSTFSNKMSPEILIQLLNQYMHIAADAVLAQGGTLDKFMGDAVMAFYNAPVAQSDHPVRAIRSAWKLSRAVREMHRGLPAPYHLKFGVGVGIGEAVVGNVGTAKMMNYTILGDAVNKVKRLQESARGGQILISQETYHQVQDYVDAQSVGNIQLKGQSSPEPVYEVLDVR